MTPTHHPPEDWLLGYVAGSLDEAMDLLIATHCTLCPQCRAAVAVFEQAAGADLTSLPDAPVASDALQAVLGRLGGQEAPVKPAPPRVRGDGVLPRPLEQYVGAVEQLPWSFVIPGVKQVLLPLRHDQMPVRLFLLGAGLRLPLHAHDGLERTLVLTGSYSDAWGTFRRGDIGIRGPEGEGDHDQRIDAGEPCIALVVADKPLIPRTVAGRFVSWFTGA